MCLAALAASAESKVDQLTAAGIVEFNAAYQAWDGARFGAAAERFHQATTSAPRSCTPFYWLGAAQFHRLLQLRSLPAAHTNSLAADAAMTAALEALGTAVELDPHHAESQALLGTLLGMKIGESLLRAMWFGPQLEEHRKVAIQYGADNPRVRYLLGTCQFHTAHKPPDLREALASFLTAEELFVAEARRPAGPLEPRWGYASCLAFIGRTCERLGQRARAADYFRKALVEHPADRLAAEGLARVTGPQ